MYVHEFGHGIFSTRDYMHGQNFIDRYQHGTSLRDRLVNRSVFRETVFYEKSHGNSLWPVCSKLAFFSEAVVAADKK